MSAVMLDPKDLPEIARLHSLLEDLATSAKDESEGFIEREARSIAECLERMIRDEDADPGATVEDFASRITKMQESLRPKSAVTKPARSTAKKGVKTRGKAAPAKCAAKKPDPAPECQDQPSAEAEPTSAEPTPGASNSAPASDQMDVDLSLVSDFVNESREHLEAANVNLLTLETDPLNEDSINAVFRAFHTIKGVAGFLGFSAIQSLAHEAENLLDQVRKGQRNLNGPVIDLIFDATDALASLVDLAERSPGASPEAGDKVETVIGRLQRMLSGEADGDPVEEEDVIPPLAPSRLGDILMQSGVATPQSVASALASQEGNPQHPRLGEVLVREQKIPARDVAQALRKQNQSGLEGAGGPMVRETVKVDAERLDRLVDMIGELVIAESMVSQAEELRQSGSSKLSALLKELDKITRDLQELGMGLRMIPLRSTFQKMARLVRDLSHKASKQVSFVVSGEETELDKLVVDKIGDPLVHMIRNAVDHGLEADVELRRQAGKSEVGRVDLRAYHRGGNIYIEIRDDGRGLDREAILAKACERGIVAPDAQLSDREVFNLIFHAGLSTANKITDVSGRGVGMDVVRKNIEALRGRVDIHSERGKGSVFTIRLPLTLAIIDGMVLRVGADRYVVPTLAIHTSLRPTPDMISTVHSRGRMLRLKDELIPIFNLDRLFNVPMADRDDQDQLIMIVENDGRKAGLAADELLGQQQIVIKPLGDALHDTPGISGGAIMPNGQISLILDVAGLIKLAHKGGNAGRIHPAAVAVAS